MKMRRILYLFVIVILLTIMFASIRENASASQTFSCSIFIDEHEYKPVIKDDAYIFMLPSEADTAKTKLHWTDSSWQIKLGKTTVKSGDIINLSNGECILGATCNGNTSDIKLTVMKGSESIPMLYLNITDEDYSYIHKNKANKAVITTDIANVAEESKKLSNSPAEIKGRGNVSWSRAKKSYQIKFDEKQDVLGMGKAKKWILLPSSYDLSMVRSAVGFELAQLLEMEYAAEYRYVDLYMGGKYYGLYIICEKTELKKNRIDIEGVDDHIENALGEDVFLSDFEVSFNNGYSTAVVNGKIIDLTGGYHLEFDNYTESKYQFTTDKECRVTINEPEMISDGKDVLTNNAYRYIIDFVQKAEDAVYGYDEDELEKYIDLESFAKMWLLKEFIADADSMNNMHFWKESDITGDGKLHAGLAWDFDNSMQRDNTSFSTANYDTLTTEGKGSAKWIGRLINHKNFREELLNQYLKYKDIFTTTTIDGKKTSTLHAFVTEIADSYSDSSKMDTVRWTGTNDYCKIPDFDDKDREDSLNVVKQFIIKRNEHMENRMVKIEKMVSPPKPLPTPTPQPTSEPTPQPEQEQGGEPGDLQGQEPGTVPDIVPGPDITEAPFITPAPTYKETEIKQNNTAGTKTKKIKKGDKIKDKTKTAIYLVKSVKNGKIEVSLFKFLKKNKKTFKVPDTVKLANGKKAKVTAISSNAFKKCKKLRKVVIGKNVRSVGKKAFKVGKRKIVIEKR